MAFKGTQQLQWLRCKCLLFFACWCLQTRVVCSLRTLGSRYQGGSKSSASLRQRQHLSGHLAAEVLCSTEMQQRSLPVAVSSPHQSPAVHSNSLLLSQAAKPPQRVFIISVAKKKTRSIRETGSPQLLQTNRSTTSRSHAVVSLSSVPNTSSTDNSSSTSQTVVSAGSQPPEQWYNHQVSGVQYFGRIPGTDNEQSVNVLYPLSAENSATSTATACNEYVYPLTVRHPTVYFTVALQDYYGSVDLGPQEKAAYSAAVNAFLAPTPDDIVSNTTILDQSYSGTVLCLPSATAILAGGDTLREFFQSTLDKDPNMVFPTAAWGTIRTTNIVYRAPERNSELTYYWFASDYGDCSALCGGGQQTRQLACMDSRGTPAADSDCPQPTPASTRPCQMQPCDVSLPTDYTMVYGPWSACNSTCGTGSRTRSATCVSKEGYVGSLGSCGTALQEVAAQTWESCTLPPCPTYVWSYSDWICDNPESCDGGTAHRDASCIQAETQAVVNETLCDLGALDSSTQPCAQRACTVFFWRTRELADCLPEDPQKPCGRYIQRRRFDCVNLTSGEVVPFISCTGPKPEIGDVECQATITCVADAYGNYVPADTIGQRDQQQTDQGTDSARPGQAVEDTVFSTAEHSEIAPVLSVPAAAAAADDASSASPATDANTSADSDASVPHDPAVVDSPDSSIDQATGTSSEADDSSHTDAAGVAPHGSNTTSPSTDPNTGAVSADNSNPASPATDIPATAAADNTSAVAEDNSGVGSGSSGSSTATTTGTSSADSQVISLSPPQAPNQDPVQQLGPGQAVPGWLLDNPTANLQSVLRCAGGRAVNPNGVCCNGTKLDLRGNCCDGVVDACGLCDGSGKAIDALGACCSGFLDARGVCCDGFIDECGVCNGQNACSLRAELLGSLATAAIYLMPQSRAKQVLIVALQGALSDAVSIAGGRTIEKQRFTVTLAAYKAPVVVGASAKQDGGKLVDTSTFVASQNEQDDSTMYPQQGDLDPSRFSSSSTLLGASSSVPVITRSAAGAADGTATSQPVYASVSRAAAAPSMPAGDTNVASGTMQQPAQADTVQEEHEQQQAPASLKQFESSSSNAAKWLQSSPGKAEKVLNASVGTMIPTKRRLQDTTPGSTIMQPDASYAPTVSISENIIITVILSSAQYTGLDSGSFMRALQHMISTPVAVPGSKSTLYVTTIKTADRPTVCGDNICQAGERQAVDNSKSCPGDCGLPFLPCPPYDPLRPTCNGKGVCYHSIGSCTCSAGYAGEDCSMCASGYKLVNGHCVTAAFIAPPRANAVVCVNGVCDRASKELTDAERARLKNRGTYSKAGVVSIGVAAGVSVVVAAAAAWMLWWRRRTYLETKCREQLAHQAQAAQE